MTNEQTNIIYSGSQLNVQMEQILDFLIDIGFFEILGLVGLY